MKVIRSSERITREIIKQKQKARRVGFVPTMGALHEGHLSLIRQAAKENDLVVVSIFVNPLQFGPREDFKKYPRPLSRDLLLCRKQGVDFVFTPSPKSLYPGSFSTFVDVAGLGESLCGKFRPGHFRGVTTVVAKLLNIIQPDRIYLGQKDAQQAIIIKRMVDDLDFSVKVRVMPTLREEDGLALSSRNIYLNKQEREIAPVLFRALNLARVLISNGAKDTVRIISRMKQMIVKKSAKIDYIAIVDLANLLPLKVVSGECLIALAVRIGRVRLIDNIIIRV